MFRIGHGYDVHRFSDEPNHSDYIMLGGLQVPCDQSLLAHSDGDVVLHALCDALLGAAGLGDIGEHFSDQDKQYENMDSAWFVKEVMSMFRDRKLKVNNVDVTIIAQKPRVSAFKKTMSVRIADLLDIQHDCVNVKATTTEKLGFIGRSEGIAAEVVTLIVAA